MSNGTTHTAQWFQDSSSRLNEIFNASISKPVAELVDSLSKPSSRSSRNAAMENSIDEAFRDDDRPPSNTGASSSRESIGQKSVASSLGSLGRSRAGSDTQSIQSDVDSVASVPSKPSRPPIPAVRSRVGSDAPSPRSDAPKSPRNKKGFFNAPQFKQLFSSWTTASINRPASSLPSSSSVYNVETALATELERGVRELKITPEGRVVLIEGHEDAASAGALEHEGIARNELAGAADDSLTQRLDVQSEKRASARNISQDEKLQRVEDTSQQEKHSQSSLMSPPLIQSSSTPAATSHDASAQNATIKGTSIKPSDFRCLELLGKGDAGHVYLVREKSTRGLFALKVLDKAELVRRKKVGRALIEQHILIGSQHPFIVPLHSTFQSSAHLYMCLEYCSGGEFFRTLQRLEGKCLPEESARFYAAEVLAALEYLHLMGFIHRDLKPENILLHQSGHIMLADFDLSKKAATDAPAGVHQVAPHSAPMVDTRACGADFRSNSFVGTEEYIAPEVIRGSGHSMNLDWWTYGILVYEMLYGTTPFKGTDRVDTFNNILAKKLRFPDHPASTTLCKGIIKKLLIKDEHTRLGARLGASEVKQHRWFQPISWGLLRHMDPPLRFKPPPAPPMPPPLQPDPWEAKDASEVRQGDDPFADFATFAHRRSE